MARYTAQQLREHAEWQEKLNGPNYIVADMLRQAADEMEREDEREKKYEYQYAARYFYPSGIIATDHIFDNPTDAKCFSGSIDGVKKVICRREVGEWEEVK